MAFIEWLVYHRNMLVVGRVAREICNVYGCQIPPEVEIGDRLRLPHRGYGVIMHARVSIGDDVTIYHRVTIGRSAWGGGRAIIGNRVVVGTGAVILNGIGDRHIGEGAIIGANSVVTSDIPAWQVWAGAPARRIGVRDQQAPSPW